MKKTKKNSLEHLDDVDVFFDPKPLSDAEKNIISEAIVEYKRKKKGKSSKRKQSA